MAKPPTSDAIMPPDKMKPLLTLSKKEPVQAAIALSVDGDGLLLLDKKAPPRKVMSMLRANAEKAKVKLNGSSLRFGRAEVDVDYDPGVVRFFINKEVPGPLRLKMIELVKRIPYQKAEFEVDPSLEEESGDEVAALQPADAAPRTPTDAPPPPAAFAHDEAGLMQQLRELIGRIPQVTATDPVKKAELTKVAMEAGNDIKLGKLDAAADALVRLRAALETGTGAAARAAEPAADSSAGAVAYGKARLTWMATRRKVLADVDRLTALLQADYADEGLAETIVDQFKARVAPVLAHFDENLADRLDEVANQADPEKRTILVQQARAIVSDYQAYLAAEPLIAVLDDNPYAPLGIAATLGHTLTALSAVIH
jgi:hypothetical protein